jgi:hypothetical protein
MSLEKKSSSTEDCYVSFSPPSVIRPWISESSSLMTPSLHLPFVYRNPALLATITNDRDEQTLSSVPSESYLGGC